MAQPLRALLEQNNPDKSHLCLFILTIFLQVCADFHLLFLVPFMNFMNKFS